MRVYFPSKQFFLIWFGVIFVVGTLVAPPLLHSCCIVIAAFVKALRL